MSTVIIYGPVASGKSQASEEVAKRFGCETIVDEWQPQDVLVTGALHLTQADQYQLNHVHLRLDDDLAPVHILNIESIKALLPDLVK